MENELKLDQQLCFSVYVLHREMMQYYRPLLERMDLTYPQFIVLMALWEHGKATVNQIGEILQLDSGTLTPLLKRMESKGLLNRTRSKVDERVVEISLTPKGDELRHLANCIPGQIIQSMGVKQEDLAALKQSIDNLLRKKTED